MEKTKIDPRIIRTRKLIMDAFIQLSTKKDFKDITIKDITKEATVNRATFYYHFMDKYDLLEKVLKENLMTNLMGEIKECVQLNEETIVNVFLSVTKFLMSLSTQCVISFKSFKTTIETIIKNELEDIFYEILLKQQTNNNEESLRIASVMLSWGIYGAAVDWQHKSTLSAEEYIKLAIPYITSGMQSLISAE
ncbi:TetR/AcrR family transcriptional regulator [Rummeliibacillus sp. POC4]|uniref:TetR/AcrR family transcriptional regulator n=1 Tax=Rummeliibacillus sp. POC4 TaxID=2305899 RepID=UPI000E671F58|nr:TetR/AcrR family transcriptional regulator [Rummeliibacillus sp. POC4]RIJ66964.1 TetR/AcrR family transcriptional regulator [Rummeliibacillus sp. POC4]